MASKQDPFFEQMFERMLPGARYSFTPQQLDDIKRAFGTRGWGYHTIDVRLSLPMLCRSYYLVLLLGPERRRLPRLKFRISGYVLSCLVSVVALGTWFAIARS